MTFSYKHKIISLKDIIKPFEPGLCINVFKKWNQNVGHFLHYGDLIMGAIASQITSLTIVYSTVYSDADQRKHQSFASLAFVWGSHRGPVNSPHKWPVTRKMFPFDDVIMCGIALWWMSLIWNQYCSGNGLVQFRMGSRKPIFNQCSVKMIKVCEFLGTVLIGYWEYKLCWSQPYFYGSKPSSECEKGIQQFLNLTLLTTVILIFFNVVVVCIILIIFYVRTNKFM